MKPTYNSAVTAFAVAFLCAALAIAADKQDKDGSSEAKQMEMLRQWEASTWRINIDLDMPSLEPEAVQYTLLDKDPVPGYMAQIKKMREFHRRQLESFETEPQKDQARNLLTMTEWDRGFKQVTGDNLWLLTKRRGKDVTPNVLSANSPDGKKWIVTKTVFVFVDKKPVCWCIPVEVKKGGPAVVVRLNKSNSFDLRGLYMAAMKEPDGDGGETESK